MSLLIVDDSETFVSNLLELFTEQAQLSCLTASDGYQGYQVWSENSEIKLIIADYNMPNHTGLEMLVKIRSEEERRGVDGADRVKVFMLSAESSENLKKEAKSLGVAAWILKPVSDQALLSVVKKFI